MPGRLLQTQGESKAGKEFSKRRRKSSVSEEGIVFGIHKNLM